MICDHCKKERECNYTLYTTMLHSDKDYYINSKARDFKLCKECGEEADSILGSAKNKALPWTDTKELSK